MNRVLPSLYEGSLENTFTVPLIKSKYEIIFLKDVSDLQRQRNHGF